MKVSDEITRLLSEPELQQWFTEVSEHFRTLEARLRAAEEVVEAARDVAEFKAGDRPPMLHWIERLRNVLHAYDKAVKE